MKKPLSPPPRKLPVFGPSPTSCPATVHSDLIARKHDCQHYDDCLDIADAREWRNFHCNNCTAYQPQNPSQRYRDHIATLDGLVEIMELLHAHDPGIDLPLGAVLDDEAPEEDA